MNWKSLGFHRDFWRCLLRCLRMQPPLRCVCYKVAARSYKAMHGLMSGVKREYSKKVFIENTNRVQDLTSL